MSIADKRLRALVVEDFHTMRAAIVRILESLNMEVLQAANGVEALEILGRKENPPEVVFTDLVMPEMDGFELCEEIRRRPDLRSLPVVVTSTHRDASYVVQALRRGADDYLTKPFTAALVERVVERAMSHV